MWTRNLLRSRILSLNLKQYNWKALPESLEDKPKAAILIPLVLEDDTVKVWLTQRSQIVRHEKGEIAFPGGMKDPCDADAVETATREAFEEIGLDSSEVELVGELPSGINLRETIVTPIVGIVSSNFYPKTNDEVSFCFKLTLERFLSNIDHQSVLVDAFATKYLVHYFEDVVCGKTVVTGALTAAYAIELACGVFQRSPEFLYSQNNYLMPEDPFHFLRFYMDGIKHHFAKKKSKL